MFGHKKHSGGLHIASRVFGLIGVCIGVIFLVWGYNHWYNQQSPSTRRAANRTTQRAVRDVPDYHPRKNTKGTRKVQMSEAELKKEIQNRGH